MAKPKKKPAAKKSAAKKPVAKKKPAKQKPAAKQKPRPRRDDAAEQAASATHALMDATWSSWGQLAPDVIAHLINPMFMGGPRWPGTRQAYRVARSGDAVLIASDGLADPYDPGSGPDDTNGLGLEMFAVTDDDIARDDVDDGLVTRYGATWLYNLVFQCAHLAAGHGGLAELLDELGAMTSELYDVKIPDSHAARFVNEHGRVGVLLAPGCAPLPAHVVGPLGPIRLVHVQLLTLDELAFVLVGGDPARHELVAKLAGKPSQLGRPSVA